ncbi:MAG: 3-hydroxyacyl-CoA dehydrogenase NAD-binding domain-containing protein, partial [Chloroflexota bacterium]|nr:3-hydroxyacyl-CoA dehydrogenase NAD-binding domain-containing protein [Chloroflexota bacterium]
MAQAYIGVVGAGQMGAGIAQVFAQHGYAVTLLDVNDAAVQRGLQAIGTSLDRLLKKGTVTAEDKAVTLERINPTMKLADMRDAYIVVEAATERKDLKFDLFRRLDELCSPQTILASNTSSISITEIAAQTRRPANVIGMHF